MKRITSLIFLLSLFSIAAAGQKDNRIAKLKSAPSVAKPEAAQATGIGGQMTVTVEVDGNGNVLEIKGVHGPTPICQSVTRPDLVALREAVKQAAKLATFEPVIEDGKPRRALGIVGFEVPVGKPANPSDDRVTDLGLLSRPGPDGSDNFLKANALNLPKPPYPPAARALRAAGPVSVKILILEDGSVFKSEALSGHPLLRASGTQAACSAKFKPTLVNGSPVKVTGVIIYNFVP